MAQSKKRQRIDSATAQVEVMQKSLQQITPPSNVPLMKDDLPFFANVIEEFARSEWTAHQLEIAAMLARTMADLNREQQELRKEGYISVRANGTTVENPRLRVQKSLSGDVLAMRRSLSLHARAKGGEARDIAKRRGATKQIEGDNPLESDLIARPS